MPSVFDIADRYVEKNAALDPIFSTRLGIQGNDSRLNDFSLSGLAARHRLDREFVEAMQQAEPRDDHERIAKAVFLERLSHLITRTETGEELCNLGVSRSPMQAVRAVFDIMPRDTSDQWRVIARRMEAVPEALRGIEESLREGQRLGFSASVRQAQACARQARVWSGLEVESHSFFEGLAEEYSRRASSDRKIESALFTAAHHADNAYVALADFLSDEYSAAATDVDGVGQERYINAIGLYLGAAIDPIEAYQWGWDELRRIRLDIDAVCNEICPGLTFRETVAKLDTEYSRVLQGDSALRDWLQALMTRTIDELNGKHFDIPAPLQRLEVRIAPPGGGAAQYYIGPSEDFTRPGTYWYPTNGRRHFPLWNEISTAYHEGVPGHHLQTGYLLFCADRLSRFQRHVNVAGHEEGWALYAERLMDEFGYLDRPEYRLNMLANSLFRAARVVVDIGMHLGLAIPTDAAFHAGEKWTPELGLAFLVENSAQTEDFLRSEIDRYLSQPAQAISYKLGERLWLEARDEAKARGGDAFDLKKFHMDALALGPMGLDQLKMELARL